MKRSFHNNSNVLATLYRFNLGGFLLCLLAFLMPRIGLPASISIVRELHLAVGSPKDWPEVTNTAVSSATPLRNGDVLLIETIVDPHALDTVPFKIGVTRCHPDGSVSWYSEHSESNVWLAASRGVLEEASGSILLLCSRSPRRDSLFWSDFLLRLDSTGTVTGNYEVTSVVGGASFSQLVAYEDGYLIGGSKTHAYPYYFEFQKLGTNLAPQWRTNIAAGSDMGMHSLVAVPAGGYVHCVNFTPYRIRRVSTNNAVVWDTSFPTTAGGGGDNLVKIIAAPGGGWFLCGHSSTPTGYSKSDAHYGEFDCWIVKVTPNGAKAWDRSFGGTGWEEFLFLYPRHDGGYLLGCNTATAGANGNKGIEGTGLWVLSLDAAFRKEAEYLLPIDSRSGSNFSWDTGDTVVVASRPLDSQQVFRAWRIDRWMQIVVSIANPSGVPYALDVSDDLSTWTPMIFGATSDIVLSERLRVPRKFYRLRELQ